MEHSGDGAGFIFLALVLVGFWALKDNADRERRERQSEQAKRPPREEG